MIQMTVEKLYEELKELMTKGMGDKKLVIADDDEGNSYHGMYYSCVSDPKEVEANIKVSNGLYGSQETNYKNIVIIG